MKHIIWSISLQSYLHAHTADWLVVTLSPDKNVALRFTSRELIKVVAKLKEVQKMKVKDLKIISVSS